MKFILLHSTIPFCLFYRFIILFQLLKDQTNFAQTSSRSHVWLLKFYLKIHDFLYLLPFLLSPPSMSNYQPPVIDKYHYCVCMLSAMSERVTLLSTRALSLSGRCTASDLVTSLWTFELYVLLHTFIINSFLTLTNPFLFNPVNRYFWPPSASQSSSLPYWAVSPIFGLIILHYSWLWS